MSVAIVIMGGQYLIDMPLIGNRTEGTAANQTRPLVSYDYIRARPFSFIIF